MLNIDQMPAGRELDALIAERVMGLEICSDSSKPHLMYHDKVRLRQNAVCLSHGLARTAVPRYSTNIASAWLIRDRLHQLKFILSVRDDASAAVVWCDIFRPGISKEFVVRDFAPTAPLAICKAALRAITKSDEMPAGQVNELMATTPMGWHREAARWHGQDVIRWKIFKPIPILTYYEWKGESFQSRQAHLKISPAVQSDP